MRFSLAAVSAIVGLVAANPVPAPGGTFPGGPDSDAGNGPDPSQVYVEGISYAGTGCPAGSVSGIFTDDRTVFTLIMDQYVASVGPGIAITESRKNCQLNVKIHYPSGWQYSIFRATYRGFASLDAGVSATQKASYYFSGQQGTCSTQTDFKGPYSKDYELTDVVPSTSTIWSPCGTQGLLNINSQVRLASSTPKGQGLLTTDSIDGSFKQVMAVQWLKCNH